MKIENSTTVRQSQVNIDALSSPPMALRDSIRLSHRKRSSEKRAVDQEGAATKKLKSIVGNFLAELNELDDGTSPAAGDFDLADLLQEASTSRFQL